MDLQTQRSLEEFLRLSDLGPGRVEARMEFSLPPFRLYIEYTQDRVLLSLARQVEACRRFSTLKALLGHCHPAATQGVALRAYIVGDQQMLSGALVPDSNVTQWIECLKCMRRLLERHAGDRQ
ncbi:hypothetical protein C4K26_4152 [Pseudomonas chlororaphis]|uniref:type III secretion chaperone SycN n=1 Tax=Pseudomonas chlororaphis TaxID=587753 RepID=UPI000F571144|nr:type III secretion chaperone SycN [Pseudomonas chlororaphis]AZD09546.1 hypothetical protein C4K26_4152 [Pseudomonas chlororaphis]